MRIGRLSIIETKTMAGHAFRVVNHLKEPVKDYHLLLDGRRFTSDKNGLAVIPYTNRPRRTPIVVTHKDFSCLNSFEHVAERYAIESALFVDRESLMKNQEAFLVVRPQLKVAGVPTDVTLLKNVNVTISSTTIDGIESTRNIPDVQLGAGAETLIKFRVPPRLRRITFRLSAEVKNMSQGKTETLTASRNYGINQIDQTDEIKDIHLVPHQGGYNLEVLGKSGEPRGKQAVSLSMMTDQISQPVRVTLQTDSKGVIELGPIPNVHRLTALSQGIKARTWNLRNQNESYVPTIHRNAEDQIQFAAPYHLSDLRPQDVSLFEIRGGRFFQNKFDAMSLDKNRLTINGLTPGDYTLRFHRSGRQTTLRISNGTPDR